MFDDNSWIKIYRKITEWEWWDDAECVKLWLWLLCKAQTKERKWCGKIIKRGELVTTLDGIKSECKISIDKIRRRLEYFRNSGAIQIETTNANHFITILNYGLYQDKNTDFDNETTNEPQANHNPTANEPQADNNPTANAPQADNNPTANAPQADNKQTTSIKELKNKRKNNIRENPNIILKEDKNERIFFKSENEKKIFSIEEIKNELGKCGIFLTEQGYKEYKENNEKPDTKFNYSGGFEYSCKQFLKKHPEYIAREAKPKPLKYEEIEVAPDVKDTLHLLIERFTAAEKKILAAVKFNINEAGDSGTLYLPNKVYFDLHKNIVLELSELLKSFYGLDNMSAKYYY